MLFAAHSARMRKRCIAVDAIPCAVEKNREPLFLLLCAGKVLLVATFLRRATNNHPIQTMATMPSKTPIECAICSTHRRTFFMAWLPATWRWPTYEWIGDLAGE